MSSRVARSFINTFAILHVVAGCGVFILTAYIIVAGTVPSIWLLMPWLVPIATYLTWVGVRGWRRPTPRVIKLLCGSMFAVLAVPYVVAVEYAGASTEAPLVEAMSASLVAFALWAGTFGARAFIRSLFPHDPKHAGTRRA